MKKMRSKKKVINAHAIRQVLEKLQDRYKVFSSEDYDRRVQSDISFDIGRDLKSMERLDAQFHVSFIVS